MRLEADFDSLDTYMSVYGDSFYSKSTLKIYLKEGLGVSLEVRDIFPRRYIFDPWSGKKYGDAKLVDGLLVAQLEGSGEWVEYKDRTISKEVLKYEYVGGCWFVFEGVSFSARKIEKYEGGCKQAEGNELVDELELPKQVPLNVKTFFLEGVLDTPPGPGWVFWEIHAKSFHIEIPES
ncbi:hypothetical protein QCD79_07945 [Pseudomonas quasicaspiana]|nr:hypothetical protein [Pseudomonas quasicaspiana]